MNIIGRSRLEWKEDDLFFQNRKMVSIVPEMNNHNRWWLMWPDETLSADWYNRTRAKENAIKIALRELNNGVEEDE